MTVDASSHVMYGEDFNQEDRTKLGSYTLSADEIIAFAKQWDPQFFHVDEQRAKIEGYFGGLIASGIQTLGIYQRLTIDSRKRHWDVIGGAGIEDLQFRKPVRPGDTLTGEMVVQAVRLQPERGRALVKFAGKLVNQHDELVLLLTMSAFVGMRKNKGGV